ncbi:MAG TPA: DUF192 domain-containing protein [Ktedonobacterales bacterium]|nr:DUF192 domain-containing protein [Ktedonobacterales bacterium]
MRYVRVINRTTGQTLAERAPVAETAWSRFAGLQLRPSLPRGEGLVILPCGSIHMFFMRFPIDVVFATREGQVVRVGRGRRPWTVGPFAPRALYCVELPAGAAAETREGHAIQLERLS